jgi:peptidyl-prolyl cis-trans isomerase C
MWRGATRSASITVIIALALAGVLAVFGTSCSKEKTGQGDSGAKGTLAQAKGNTKMVAKVNGTKITEDEITKETERLTMQMGGQANPQQMEAMKGALRKQAIESMISRALLEQAAKKEGIKASKEDVAARMADIKKNFASEQEFTDRIKSMGMTPEDVQREIESGLSFEALLAKHTSDVKTPTEADLRSFYDSNRSEFQQPERVKASHILVTVAKDDTEAQKAEKLAKITKIRNDLKGGADFAQTATQYSDCPSKEKGGDLGYFGKGQMVPPFENAAFALKMGDLSDIVQTDFGYHIIKVTDRQEARDIPFEEAKQDIASYLDNQGKQAAVSTYIEGLRTAAKIEYADTTGTGK